MPRPPKEGSRRNNPDYSPVTAQIPKGLGKRLRLFVTQKETTISEVVEKALAEYLDRNQVQVSVLQPNSIGEVVRQNFWTLREHNIKNIDAIAKGAAPTKADIVEISSILDFDQGELLRLAMSEFGELPKAKPKDKEPS
ncbi:MAG TPA: hypothetical protein V6D14_15595 [Coleofasciculaceae cyanobacterium]|jgi:hypothetical protein